MEAAVQFSVPPGFRFHPTDEELLNYYLRKKVAREAMELDVIREVDLNKLEPWDLRDVCRIGSGPQNEWYFFSHKDKKYPSGTRTNRATEAGFWKATGRDKVIFHTNSKRIGMRKTLVFYTGRAPRGNKTEWIMHEYRLHDDNHRIHEEGWVVCRVYRKKNHQRSLSSERANEGEQFVHWGQRQNPQWPYDIPLASSIQLPQLLSPDPAIGAFMAAVSNPSSAAFSQNLMRPTTGGGGVWKPSPQQQHQLQQRFHGEGSIVDKLLASHHNLDQIFHGKWNPLEAQAVDQNLYALRFLPNDVMGCEADLLKLTK